MEDYEAKKLKDNLLIVSRETLTVYRVESICMCDRCRERGMPELKIVGPDGAEDYITVADLFGSEYKLLRAGRW